LKAKPLFWKPLLLKLGWQSDAQISCGCPYQRGDQGLGTVGFSRGARRESHSDVTRKSGWHAHSSNDAQSFADKRVNPADNTHSIRHSKRRVLKRLRRELNALHYNERGTGVHQHMETADRIRPLPDSNAAPVKGSRDECPTAATMLKPNLPSINDEEGAAVPEGLPMVVDAMSMYFRAGFFWQFGNGSMKTPGGFDIG